MSQALKVSLALAVVYLAWGSSYLAIKLGVRDVSPWFFNGLRFLLVAPLMGLIAHRQQAPLPASAHEWRVVLGTGLLMLVLSSGLMAWAQQWVASGQAALIMATSALWMAWFGSWGRVGDRVGRVAVAGLIVGLGGVALLIGDGLLMRSAPWTAYAAISIAAMTWPAGSVVLRRHPLTCGPTMTVAIQSALAAVLVGGWALISGARSPQWTPSSLAALAYLVLFGSVAGYGAYYWLVHHLAPAKLGTYAYVNPAIAVLLGYWVLDERLSLLQTAGALSILVAVILVMRPPKRA